MAILPDTSFSSSAVPVPRVVDSAVENNNTMARINNVVGLRDIELMDVTASLRVCIFNYLGETQEELVDLRLISKQLYEDCKRPGIEWKIFISMIEISPIHGGGSMEGLVLKFWRHLMDNQYRQEVTTLFSRDSG